MCIKILTYLNIKKNLKYLSCIIIFFSLSIKAMATVCEDNTPNIVYGKLWNNTIWTEDNSPYIIGNDLTVEQGITLTINPGVKVIFCKGTEINLNEKFSIIINGKLIAKGNTEKPIIFTSGDRNPEPGDWDSIKFSSTSDELILDNNENYINGSILENVIFEYGSKALDIYKPIYISSIIVKNSEQINIKCNQKISELNYTLNTDYIRSDSSLSIQNSKFHLNYGGIYSNKSIIIDNCTFNNNRFFKISIGSDTNSSITNSIFDNNVIKIDSNGNLNINNCVFKDNHSNDHRFSVINNNGILYIHNSDFVNSYLRAIESKGKVFIDNSTFSDLFQFFYSDESSSQISVNNSNILNSNGIESTGQINVSNSKFYNISEAVKANELTNKLNIANSLFYKCSEPVISECDASISNCTFTENRYNDIYLYGENTSVQIQNNNFIGFNIKTSFPYYIYNDTINDISAINNFWDFTSPSSIYTTIYDKRHNIEKGLVTFEPFFDKLIANTPDYHPPIIKISPDELFFIFENNNVNSKNIKSFNVVNDGKSILDIDSIVFMNTNSKNLFHMITDSCSNTSLSNSDICTISYLFESNGEKFIKNTLHIPSNGINDKSKDAFINFIGYIPDESFETRDFSSFKWVKSSEDDWVIQNSINNTGEFSLKSNLNTELSESNFIELTLNVIDGYIIFNVYTDAHCKFYINNEVYRLYGLENSWRTYKYYVETGIHRLRWEHLNTYGTYFYLDSIKFPPLNNDNIEECFVTVEPSIYSFGFVSISDKKNKNFLVTNKCSADIQIKSIFFNSDNPYFIINNNNCSNELLNNNSCSFDIAFSPIEEGFQSNQLIISNDNFESIIEISGMTPIKISGNVKLKSIAGNEELFVKDAEVILSGTNYQYTTNTNNNGEYELFVGSYIPGIHQLTINSLQLEPFVNNINVGYNSISMETIFMECKKCCNDHRKVTLESIIYDLQVLTGLKIVD